MVKKFLVILFLGFLCTISTPARAQDSGERILEYQTNLGILEDGTLTVSEWITYDFGENQRHGIFRNIPYKYKARGGNFSLQISDISVVNEKDYLYEFTKSRSGGELVLKIGDPDSFVSGVRTYIISYKVKRAINFFDDHDELYWNAIGTGWTVPIERTGARLMMHTDEELRAECFTGGVGSSESSCTINKAPGTLDILSNSSLAPGEGLTIVAGFSKGIIPEPTRSEIVLATIKDNWVVGLPALALIVMFLLWWMKGRDAKVKGAIVPQYDAPKKLPPLLLGTLSDMRTDSRDIAGEIIYLATKGYLRIERSEKKQLLLFKKEEFTLIKLKSVDEPLVQEEKDLFNALFASGDTVSLSSLRKNHEFYRTIESVKSSALKGLSKQGYFKGNPTNIKVAYIIVGAAISFFGIIFGQDALGAIGFFSLILTSFVIIVFGIAMPARSRQGSELNEEIKGLKLYMTVAEKDRMEFHNAPELNPQTFEKLLPYAVALGVEKQWAKKFGDLAVQPSWYSDGAGHAFTAFYLSNQLSNFSSVAVAQASAASGGSGFSGGGSGGGFGGGGGGSW